MLSMHQKTRDTYNYSAGSLSKHYDEIGPRDGDINLAFMLAGNPGNAVVLELGCGNGRDARAIAHRTPNYTGIDTSKEMVDRAIEKVPEGHFEVGDATTYNYQGPYDLVFAFATLRHLNTDEVATVMKKVYDSIRPGGVFYISSNYAARYRIGSRSDEYGTREIHYYNPTILQKYAPTGFRKIQEIFDKVDDNEWFEVAFQKQ